MSAARQIALLNSTTCASANMPAPVAWVLINTGIPVLISPLSVGPTLLHGLQALTLLNVTYNFPTGLLTLGVDITAPLTAQVSLSFGVQCQDTNVPIQLGVYAITSTTFGLVSNQLPLVCNTGTLQTVSGSLLIQPPIAAGSDLALGLTGVLQGSPFFFLSLRSPSQNDLFTASP